jgi:hypothetical protein
MKAILVTVLAIFSAFAARADLTASLSSSVKNSASGQTLVFCGTLVNTSTTDELFLNNMQYTLGGSPGCFVAGTNAFFANVPGILNPGETYTGELFSVALSGAAPAADYSGTVTMQGGSDIFAANNLAAAAFTVLSPSVTIVATGTSAAEDGPVSGTFTITRTGGTEVALPVSFNIGGTAANGADYQAIGTPVTIASGSSSATVTITPISTNIARANPTVTLAVASSLSYNLGGAVSDTITIQIKPADAWRYTTFGALANSPQAADASAWSGSGIVNLAAFALNINPIIPNRILLPTAALLSNYLTLTYAPNPAATDVSYSVEASTDLIGWSAANVQSTSNPGSAPPGSVSFRYIYPIGTAGRVFLRLRVTRTDE